MTALTVMTADIAQLNVDAVVNAANSDLAGGGGVDGAIHRAAGYKQLQQACRLIGGCPTGEVRVTQGFDLPARYIFHAVGPVWHGGNQGEPRLLASCYRSAILKAREMHLQSIAFPAISCGVYGYPHDQAVEVAISAVRAAAEAGDLPALREVIFCCFDEAMAERYRACLSQADNP